MGIKSAILLVLIAGSISLAACAGGGSSGMAGALNSSMAGALNSPMTNGTGSNSVSPPISCCSSNTGISGSVATPIPASFGSNPVAPQLASPAGASFDSAVNATFPLLFTGLQASPGGLVPFAPGQGATITVNAPSVASQGGAVSWQLSIPAANVNDAGWEMVSLRNNMDSPIQELSYVAFGEWNKIVQGSPTQETFTHFIFGYETPAASMPASGMAAFTGNAQGQVFLPMNGQDIQSVWLGGNASFSVDFASGKISGAFTGLSYYDAANMRQPWNDVSVSAAIVASSNRFGGTTAVTSSPASSFSLKPSATGSINGAFFCPAAQQLGAVWTLSDGTSSALGSVTAGR
jgi:hypothetical protein